MTPFFYTECAYKCDDNDFFETYGWVEICHDHNAEQHKEDCVCNLITMKVTDHITKD